MPKTRTELAEEALGVLQMGQQLNPEDVTYVEARIDPLVAQLGLEGSVYVGDADQIDDAFFLPLAEPLAHEVPPRFGLPMTDVATKEAANQVLRRLARDTLTDDPVPAEYF
ncbi:hypothetical protein P7L87_26260 [Vibrio parahaemolyticus]|nr:hypothetical protein [Vibrio parahaemolyticus]